MMNYLISKYRFIFFAIILFTVCSCEKEVDVDLRSVTPRIVIEGIVAQDELAKVRVSLTKDFDDNEAYVFLKDAIVKIWDDAGNTETLIQDNTGWYIAQSLTGEVGKTYQMSVTYDKIEYTATSQMPPLVTLDSLSMYKILSMDYALPMIHFKDPIGEINKYYRCLVYINGEQRHDGEEMVMSTEFMDGSPIHQFLPVSSRDDDEDPIKKGDNILIEFQCIDKGAYTFFDTLSNIETSNNNPTSNIKGGALGYFMAFSHDEMTIVAEWK